MPVKRASQIKLTYCGRTSQIIDHNQLLQMFYIVANMTRKMACPHEGGINDEVHRNVGSQTSQMSYHSQASQEAFN